MRHLLVGLVGLFSLCAVTPGRAAVLFQSIPDLTVMPSNTGLCSSCNGKFEVYDDFRLTTSAVINKIDFAVSIINFSTQPITVSIYALLNGQIDNTPKYSYTFSSYDYAPTGRLTNVVEVLPGNLSLAAGDYDITFYNSTNLDVPAYSVSGRSLYQAGSGSFTGYSTGFKLIGTAVPAPEPASITLLGLSLVGLGAIRRRRAACRPDGPDGGGALPHAR